MDRCTVRRLQVLLVQSQSSANDDGIDSRWNDVLAELSNSSGVEPVMPTLQSLRDLERSIKSQGYQTTPVSRQFKDKEYVQSTDFALNSNSLSQLETILGEQLYSSGRDDEEDDLLATNDGGSLSWNDRDEGDEGLFLDAETYLSYSSGDGSSEDFVKNDYPFDSTRTGGTSPSMSLGRNFIEFAIPPDAPYDSNYNASNKENKNGSNSEGTLADILALQKNMAQRRPPSPEEEKAIFEQVFQGEQAYFEKTSSIFREGLTNKTAAQAATFMRRNKQYRKNLMRELSKLEKQIQDFEVLLENQAVLDRLQESNNDMKEEHTIERGNSQDLGKSERSEAAVGLESTVSDAWVQVDDPSTGETFFWNTATEEMKVSLDEQNDS